MKTVEFIGWRLRWPFIYRKKHTIYLASYLQYWQIKLDRGEAEARRYVRTVSVKCF